jgi:hypothetical protein
VRGIAVAEIRVGRIRRLAVIGRISPRLADSIAGWATVLIGVAASSIEEAPSISYAVGIRDRKHVAFWDPPRRVARWMRSRTR